MAAYIVATYDINDASGYEGYVPGVLPLLQKHGSAFSTGLQFKASTCPQRAKP